MDGDEETRECIRRLVSVIKSATAGDFHGPDQSQRAHIKKVVRLLSLSQDQICSMRPDERAQVCTYPLPNPRSDSAHLSLVCSRCPCSLPLRAGDVHSPQRHPEDANGQQRAIVRLVATLLVGRFAILAWHDAVVARHVAIFTAAPAGELGLLPRNEHLHHQHRRLPARPVAALL